jgi:molybdate transport system ATP-binding protein
MIEIDIGLKQGGFRLDATFSSQAGITALFGRSGAGKSTLVAAVAGLLRPERGRIRLGDTVLFDAAAGIFVPPHKRRVGLVFQDAQLFPHMTAGRNLSYGRWFRPRRTKGLSEAAIMDALGIGHLLARRPLSLSGGERQRVAIGRALLAAPRLLVMDEPLASLDGERKLEILPLIERVRDEFSVPVLYVTHSVEEIARLAGEVVVLVEGRVVRCGPPETILQSAMPPSSAERFGAMSILKAQVREHDEVYGMTLLDHPAGEIAIAGRVGPPGSEARIAIHGTDVSLALRRPSGLSIRTVLRGTIKSTMLDAGPVARVDVTLAGGDMLAAFVTRRSVHELGLREGDPVHALVKAASLDQGAGRR